MIRVGAKLYRTAALQDRRCLPLLYTVVTNPMQQIEHLYKVQDSCIYTFVVVVVIFFFFLTHFMGCFLVCSMVVLKKKKIYLLSKEGHSFFFWLEWAVVTIPPGSKNRPSLFFN